MMVRCGRAAASKQKAALPQKHPMATASLDLNRLPVATLVSALGPQ
jgi:hypothetical protein